MNTRGVALVTGGGRGIGLGISRCLAAEGFDLAIVGRSPEQDRQEVLRELRLTGGRVRYCPGNIAQASDRSDILKRVKEEFRSVHVLVNNGGLVPQARWGTPEDVGKVVASLARRDFPYSTGAVLTVDGGLTIHTL